MTADSAHASSAPGEPGAAREARAPGGHGDGRARPGPAVAWCLSLALGALAALLVGLATATYGVSGEHFAMNNIGAAQGLVCGRGLSSIRGEPFVLWGPTMPAVLAALHLAGFTFLDGARWMTVASALVFVALHTRLVLAISRTAWPAVVSGLWLVFSPQFLPIMASLRSQPLFLALAAVSLWSLVRYLATRSNAWLVAAVLAATGTVLHRYECVLVVAAQVAVILARPSAGALRQRVAAAAFAAAVPAIALAALLARNVAVEGSMLGPRPTAPEGEAGAQLLDAWRTIALWAAPWAESLANGSAAVLALALLAAIGLVRLLRRPDEVARRDALAVYASFAVVYGGGLIAIAAVLWIDLIGERILFPMLAFSLGLLLIAAEELARTGGRIGVAAQATIWVALATALGHEVPATVARLETMRRDGAGGFATRHYAGRELARWLREHPLEGRVWSNIPEYVLLFGDREATYVEDRPGPLMADLEADPATPAWLVWLGMADPGEQKLAALLARTGGETVARLGEDVVVRLR